MVRAKKVCAKPGCPSVAAGSYCAPHQAEADKARGNSNQRGYGAKHQRKRQAWAHIVSRGQTPCARCGLLIEASEPWDLGHDDNDRTKYNGPEHANKCNRSAAGRKSHNQ